MPTGTSGRAGPTPRSALSITTPTKRATITAGSVSPACELPRRAVFLLPRGVAISSAGGALSDDPKSYDPNNVFARLLRGELHCREVYEDEHLLAFPDLRPP